MREREARAHRRAVGGGDREARRPCRVGALLAELVEVDGRVGRHVWARVVDRLRAGGAVEAGRDRLHRDLRGGEGGFSVSSS